MKEERRRRRERRREEGGGGDRRNREIGQVVQESDLKTIFRYSMSIYSLTSFSMRT